MQTPLDNPIGHLSVEKTSAAVEFSAVVDMHNILITEDALFDFETEGGDVMVTG